MADLESTKDVVENLFKDISEREDEEGLDSLEIEDIMEKQFMVLHPETDMRETLNIFVKEDLHDAPVVEEETVVGLVKTQDIWQALEQQFLSHGSEIGREAFRSMVQKACSIPVEEIMQPAVSVNVERNLTDAIIVMEEKNLTALPVTKGNRLVGMLRDSDVMRAILQSLFSRG